MKLPPIPSCQWISDRLLVRTRKAAKLALPGRLLRTACEAGVACVVNLLSKAEYLEADDDAHHGPTQPFICHAFWPARGCLPTARQVRQAIGWIEDAHALGLRVLLNGVGHPARAIIVAGCWRAREGYQGAKRLDGFKMALAVDETVQLPTLLSAAERAFVADWPTGQTDQLELADMAWSERDEVFPFASVEHWLRVLPTVRVYAGARRQERPVDVPVSNGRHVDDGAGISLDVDELRRGTWIGERTLRLTNGWQVVFVSPYR